MDQVEVGRRVAGHIRVALKVADAVEATRRLVDAGAALIAEPTATPWNTLNARLDAPAGLQLTLFSGDEGGLTPGHGQARTAPARSARTLAPQETGMKLEVSKVIDRPPAVVFDFYAVNHLRNHPRWDPKMQLRQLTDGPIGVGTRFERRHTRVGTPVEGTMEVVEFEPDRAMGVVIHDATPAGPLEVRSRATVEPAGEGRSTVTIRLDIPAMEATMDPSMVEASISRMKELIESET